MSIKIQKKRYKTVEKNFQKKSFEKTEGNSLNSIVSIKMKFKYFLRVLESMNIKNGYKRLNIAKYKN